MAEAVTIARPYAEAVFKLARERDTLAQWSRMLVLLEVVVANEQVTRCIGDPTLTSRQVENLVLGVCGQQLDGAGRNFVQVLSHNSRLAVVAEIRALFEELKRDHEGVLEVQIHSAFALDDDQKSRLVRRLESKYSRKVSAQVSVDPRLIGGVKIVVGDKVLDATVRGKLDAMTAALAH